MKMTIRHPLYLVTVLLLAVAGVSCNSNSYYYSESETTSAGVTSFSLKNNKDILDNLDSVFFSIDLINFEIFNADSLPNGTDVSRLCVSIGTPTISRCELTYRIRGTERDTTVSYLASPNDSINFADGPVKLSITSADGLTKRDYTVRVNVHNTVPDTLYWNQMARRRLPSGLADIDVQKTISFKGKTICLTSSSKSGKAWLAVTDNLAADSWTGAETQLPADAEVSSLTATDNALFILDSKHNLYTATSAENPVWQPTGTAMTYIYGAYGSLLLGNLADASGHYDFVTYPATTVTPVPESCPVSGTSAMLTYDSRWASAPIVMFLGGRLASGKCSGAMWGFDGTVWACLTTSGVPEGDGIAVCRYPTFRVSESSWSVERRDAILAIGGRASDSVVDDLVYVSYDEGITWTLASDYLRLPDYIAPRADAQLIVETVDMSLSRSSSWQGYPSRPLPPFVKVESPAVSRVIAPVTEWTCPYIYMFGGVDSEGRLYDQVWRGVINRLTFNPLY